MRPVTHKTRIECKRRRIQMKLLNMKKQTNSDWPSKKEMSRRLVDKANKKNTSQNVKPKKTKEWKVASKDHHLSSRKREESKRRRNCKKNYETFPRSEERSWILDHESVRYNKGSKIHARFIIMKFQTPGVKRLKDSQGKGDKQTTNKGMRIQLS